ncbi:MAG: insulinase family protein [Deltaproteobacteria bacterium]|nr:insulinase family protein [Deltaproteobacteria bacterium]
MAEFDIVSEKSFPNKIKFKHFKLKGFGTDIFLIEDPSSANLNLSLGFVTIPENSKGIPHILEHSVLCGSKKYPLKDPFAGLLRSSVQTFLNAITFHNFTTYPFATFVEEDFFNLFDVYWDSIFQPLLLEETFWLQGIHPISDNGISFQGVVYNEMKGYYSEPFTIFWRSLFKSFFDGTHLVNDSGGDPREILTLTYEELLQFYRKNYTIDNLRVCFYGQPLPGLLPRLAQKITESERRGEKFFDQDAFPVRPSNLTVEYQRARPLDREWYSINFFTKNRFNFIIADLYNACLLGFPTSPLFKAIQDLGYGEKVLRLGMLDNVFGSIFSVGVQDAVENFAVKEKEILKQVIFEVIQRPFDPKLARPIIENFKASFTERFLNNPDRGIQTLLKTAYCTPFGLGPDTILSEIFDFVKADFDEILYKLNQVGDSLLTSGFQSSVSLIPSENFIQEFIRAELDRASQIKISTDEVSFAKIASRVSEYKEKVDDDISVLPSLSIKSFSPSIKDYSLKREAENLFWYNVNTNGLLYLTVIVPMVQGVDPEILSFLCFVRQHVGTPDRSPFEFSLKMFEIFSSFSFYPFYSLDFIEQKVKVFLRIDAVCLERKTDEAVSFITSFFEEFSSNEAEQIIAKQFEEYKVDLINQLKSHPARFARKFALSMVDSLGNVDDRVVGVQQIKYVQRLKFDSVYERVRQTWSGLLGSKPKIFFAGEESLATKLTRLIVGENPKEIFIEFSPNTGNCWHIPIDLQVSSSAVAFHLEEPLLLSRYVEKLVSETYLWSEIRTKGGAYGSSMSFQSYGNVGSFVSWDDPSPERSQGVYRSLSSNYFKPWLKDLECERTAVTVLGEYDAPQSPMAELSRAVHYHVFNISREYRESIKRALFSVNREMTLELIDSIKNKRSEIGVIIGKCDVSKLPPALGFVARLDLEL